MKSASDDKTDKEAQQKEKKSINDRNRRRMRKQQNILAQQATDGASLDLTGAPPSDLEAFMREQNAQLDQLKTDIQKMLQNYESALRQTMAKMGSQPCTGAVGGATVSTKKKRKPQNNTDTTGPAKSKKPRAVKKPEPPKELSVTPASPVHSSQLASWPKPAAQTHPHAKKCKLSFCDNNVKGDAEHCTDCLERPCSRAPIHCNKYAVPGEDKCQDCQYATLYCQTLHCGNEVGLAQNFCFPCMGKAELGSSSCDDSSDREHCYDVCAQCYDNIPTNQGYCTSCKNRTTDEEDHTEIENSANED